MSPEESLLKRNSPDEKNPDIAHLRQRGRGINSSIFVLIGVNFLPDLAFDCGRGRTFDDDSDPRLVFDPSPVFISVPV
ncbi:hypothetical protein EVAR_53886_1 [Eumeta japonica]|uniref:Uncharacterized protein n=1 Tax=Eumeta variegata TaxID=151549 RepID=A0A4C1XFC0_EUMVA|nr:hypothetical protein EVAR_53886_1 [Eumeta japonica]